MLCIRVAADFAFMHIETLEYAAIQLKDGKLQFYADFPGRADYKFPDCLGLDRMPMKAGTRGTYRRAPSGLRISSSTIHNYIFRVYANIPNRFLAQEKSTDDGDSECEMANRY
jgi:hypothetical protein